MAASYDVRTVFTSGRFRRSFPSFIAMNLSSTSLRMIAFRPIRSTGIFSHSTSFHMPEAESDFSKDLLLLFLYEYRMFNKSLAHASKEYGTGGDFNEAMSKVMGFESEQEFNNVMFLREIMRFINSTSEISDIVRVYDKQPELAKTRLKNLLSEHSL